MSTVRRRLDAELIRRGLAATPEDALAAIAAGRVTVSGAPAASPNRLVGRGDPILVAPEGPSYVSRAGFKLAGALDAFGVDPTGVVALDVGASTGGFTDCLLQRGAAAVVTVDVGNGQLDWSLRTDPRVEVHERTDIRTFIAPAPYDLVTVDVSFIGLASLAVALSALVAPGGAIVALVKPQFEAARDDVPPDGIVRDEAVRTACVEAVTSAFVAAGLVPGGTVESVLRGGEGNVEFFVHMTRPDAGVSA